MVLWCNLDDYILQNRRCRQWNNCKGCHWKWCRCCSMAKGPWSWGPDSHSGIEGKFLIKSCAVMLAAVKTCIMLAEAGEIISLFDELEQTLNWYLSPGRSHLPCCGERQDSCNVCNQCRMHSSGMRGSMEYSWEQVHLPLPWFPVQWQRHGCEGTCSFGK